MSLRIYIVGLQMSSPNVIESSEMIDENTKEIKYKYPKSVRTKIERVRNKYRTEFYDRTVSFYGVMQLTNEEGLEELRELVKEADKEMKEIMPELYAKLVAIPVDERYVEEGELYRKILYAIQYQIIKSIYNRIKGLKSEEPQERTKESIREMLEKLRALNIIRDDRVDQLIASIEQMLDMKTEEIKKTMLEELNFLEQELEKLL
ncbi:MAG: hypothetical protein ACXQS2_04350 [Methermicoccaceae archaeon]